MNFFKSQDEARRNTLKLVVLFILAILSLIILTNLLLLVGFGLVSFNASEQQDLFQNFDWNLFIIVGTVVAILIVLGSTYKVIALSGGGSKIADMMNAKKILNNTDDPDEKKILNVVEEMAIASGTSVPPVYLINEESINAFAAGYTTRNAIIGITHGAIKHLSRDQLQGVIAHEFSHILNGDMRLNIRLIGLLHGILLIGLLGEYILRGAAHSRGSRNDGAALFLLLGAGFIAIGYAGTFFGSLIKAAVSRQREYLADASAVQYTRNPEGIAGALKFIGGKTGSLLRNPAAHEINHALFSNGLTPSFSNLFSTHPPLDDRILRIEPNWDGKYLYPKPVFNTQDGDSRKTGRKETLATIMATATTAFNDQAITDHVGQPNRQSLGYAQQLLSEIPGIQLEAAREPCAARALIYYIVLDENDDIRQKQVHHLLTSAVPGVYKELKKLTFKSNKIKPEHRLPLVDVALSTLQLLSKKQYQIFRENLVTLIEFDEKINLMEWSLQKIVIDHLDEVFFDKTIKPRYNRTLKHALPDCAVLISLLVHCKKQPAPDKETLFRESISKLGHHSLELIDKSKLNLRKLNTSLNHLKRLKPVEKSLLINACAYCIGGYASATITEIELFRAIADTLECPVPPINN